jgi:hypothetical protein
LLGRSQVSACALIAQVLGAASAVAVALLLEAVGMAPLHVGSVLKDLFEPRSSGWSELVHDCHPKS